MKEMKMTMESSNSELISLKIMGSWELTLESKILRKKKMFKFVGTLVAWKRKKKIQIKLPKKCTVLRVIAILTQISSSTKCRGNVCVKGVGRGNVIGGKGEDIGESI